MMTTGKITNKHNPAEIHGSAERRGGHDTYNKLPVILTLIFLTALGHGKQYNIHHTQEIILV